VNVEITSKTRAVVTGAGSGLGRSFACELARRGAKVVISDVSQNGLDETARLVRELSSAPLVTRCDVARSADVLALAELATRELGGTDLLINNAGIAVAGPIGEVALADWRAQIDVNLFGVIHGCHSFVPGMLARGSGHILNVASIAGIVFVPGMGPYNVTKAGVIALSETLRGEIAARGVGVTCLCPSFFPTEIVKSGRGVLDPRQVKLAERLMQRSEWSADDIARIGLDAVESDTFIVLPHADGRWAWRLKRVSPWLYRKAIDVLAKRVGKPA
jgi:NAD(P)-dependent dehydrogenase (short-subunit alcohol dehydrogenase family)